MQVGSFYLLLSAGKFHSTNARNCRFRATTPVEEAASNPVKALNDAYTLSAGILPTYTVDIVGYRTVWEHVVVAVDLLGGGEQL